MMDKLLQEHHMLASLRSLMWSFGSPALVTSSSDQRWPDDEWCSWRALELAGLLDKPDCARQLDNFLESEKDHRLGARFERLIEFGLQHLPGVSCVQRRLQVYQEKQTLGEFDFIVKDTITGEFEHWEVACKFYLGVPTPSLGRSTSDGAAGNGQLHWVGPGKRDSLIRKLKHLTLKQLILSDLPDAETTVDALGANISNVRALVKGRLFFPLGIDQTEDAVFKFDGSKGSIEINPEAPSGFWCDVTQARAAKTQIIYSVEKTGWLDPATDRRHEVDIDSLSRLVESSPQCVDVVTYDGELQRWFIVRDGWFEDLDCEAVG